MKPSSQRAKKVVTAERPLPFILEGMWLIFFLLYLVVLSYCQAALPVGGRPVFGSVPGALAGKGLHLLYDINLALCSTLLAASLAGLALTLRSENRLGLCHSLFQNYLSSLFMPSPTLQAEYGPSAFRWTLRKDYKTLSDFTDFILACRAFRIISLVGRFFWVLCTVIYCTVSVPLLIFPRAMLAALFALGAFGASRLLTNIFTSMEKITQKSAVEIASADKLTDLPFLLKSGFAYNPSETLLLQRALAQEESFFLFPHAMQYMGEFKNFWYLCLLHSPGNPDSLYYASLRPVPSRPGCIRVRELFVDKRIEGGLPKLRPPKGSPSSLPQYFSSSAPQNEGQKLDATIIIFLPPSPTAKALNAFSLAPGQGLRTTEPLGSLPFSLKQEVALGSELETYIDILGKQCFQPENSFAVTRFKQKEEEPFTLLQFADNVCRTDQLVLSLFAGHPILLTPWDS